MSNNKVNRRDIYNRTLKEFSDYYQEPIFQLVELCRSLGLTDTLIAKTIHMDQGRFCRRYPRAEKGGK